MAECYEQLKKQAYFVCCPMCDEKVCVGREKCEEIKKFVDTRTPKEFTKVKHNSLCETETYKGGEYYGKRTRLRSI